MALKKSLQTDGDSTDAVSPSHSSPGRLGSMQHQAHSESEIARRRAAEKRVDEALARLDAELYGYCAKCGDAIEDTRLERDPAIILCAKCGGEQQ